MIKGTAFSLIKRLIGEYLHNFSKDQMNLQVLDKKMTLSNLILKPEKINEELNKYEYFFTLKAGLIKELNIEIPKIIEYKEITVQIKELFLILGPNMINFLKYEKKFFREYFNKKKNNILLKIKKNEDNKSLITDDDILIFNIIKNMKCIVNKVHIRYEDDQLTYKTPISLGLVINTISINTFDVNLLEQKNSEKEFINITIIEKINKNPKNSILKTLEMDNLMIYFNSASELYIPFSLYQETRLSSEGIFEAINYFDLEYYMNMYFEENNQKYIFKIFEAKSEITLNITLFSELMSIDLSENIISLDLISDKGVINLKKQTIDELTHFYEFLTNYSIINFLTFFKPNIRPLTENYPEIENKEIHDKLKKIIIKEWFSLAIWYNRLIAYSNLERNDLIDNTVALFKYTSILHCLENPDLMKNKNFEKNFHLLKNLESYKLISKKKNINFNIEFVSLDINFYEEEKIAELQMKNFKFEFSKILNLQKSKNISLKSESFNLFLIKKDISEENKFKIFQPINSSEKIIPQPNFFLMRSGFNLILIFDENEEKKQILSIKITLNTIEADFISTNLIYILEYFNSLYMLPYFQRNANTNSIKNKIEKKIDNPKYVKSDNINGSKNDIPGEKEQNKNIQLKSKSELKNEIPFIKYELNSEITDRQEMISPIFHHDKIKNINEDIKILNEINTIKSKEKIKKIKRNLESFIENLNSFTIMLSIIFEKIQIKIRNNKSTNSDDILKLTLPIGKIVSEINSSDKTMKSNYIEIMGIRLDYTKDLNILYLFLEEFIHKLNKNLI